MVDLSRLAPLFLLAAVVYVLALSRLLAMARRWWAKRSGNPFAGAPPSRLGKGLQVALFGVAAAGLLCLAWAFYEPYFPEVTRVEIRTEQLSAPIRLVQISDLHSDPTVRLEDRLPELIRGLHPDLVVFTGDAINSDGGLENFRRCMTALAAICPTFGVQGNWEAWWFTYVDVFARIGVQELDGQAVRVRVRDQEIWLSGAAVEHERRIAPMLAQVPDDRFSVLLHHYPSQWEAARRGGADLHLAGDTHGGQVALPLLGPLARIARGDGQFYASGLHRQGDSRLYVNRGIGMEGGIVPRVRFGVRPEITVIEITPAR